MPDFLMGVRMAQLTRKKGPVHLRFDGGKVLITPDDYPRFSMAAKRAVKVLQRQKVVEERVQQFNDEYLPLLYRWCVDHRAKVQACYLGTPSPHGLRVFVVSATDQYDFDLGDEISRLGLQLEREGWSSNILQIPDGEEEDLLTFFNPDSSLEVYAQAKAAPGKG